MFLEAKMKPLINTFLVSALVVHVMSDSGVPYELDFLQSFFLKAEKLTSTTRLNNLGEHWLAGTSYQNAVGITVENWSNHKLEYPEQSISEGGIDRWLNPVEVEKHTRDISVLAYGTRGSYTKGTVSYLIEDSWPRQWVSIGWHYSRNGLDVILALGKTHLDYDDLLRHESNAQFIQDGMRFFKATDKFVLSVSCNSEGDNMHLTLSFIPQNMDFWAWEKYYKTHSISQSGTVQKVDIPPTTWDNLVSKKVESSVKLENELGIFERKELLLPGKSADLQGDRSEREILAKQPGSVGAAIRLENWSKYPIQSPNLVSLNFGKESSLFPVVGVRPGRTELALLNQNGGVTGVSGVIRWPIGNGSTILSLMISVPYNSHMWGTWVGMGLFKVGDASKASIMPDFDAMYSGTPDSAWFVRDEVGKRLEFSNDEFILVLDSSSGSSKPVIRLALLPVNTAEGAPTIQMLLDGKEIVEEEEKEEKQKRTEGSHSQVSALSSSAQCFCPCLGSSSSVCSSIYILAAVLWFNVRLHLTTA